MHCLYNEPAKGNFYGISDSTDKQHRTKQLT